MNSTVTWLQLLITGGLGAALATPVLANLLRFDERRQQRVAVHRAYASVEDLRWRIDLGDGPYPHREALKAGIRELQTAALIARVPRRLVQAYCRLADLGNRLAAVNVERHGGPGLNDDEAWLDSEVEDLIREAGRSVVDHVWAPTRSRLKVRWTLTAQAAARESVLGGHPDWKRVWDATERSLT